MSLKLLWKNLLDRSDASTKRKSYREKDDEGAQEDSDRMSGFCVNRMYESYVDGGIMCWRTLNQSNKRRQILLIETEKCFIDWNGEVFLPVDCYYWTRNYVQLTVFRQHQLNQEFLSDYYFRWLALCCCIYQLTIKAKLLFMCLLI